MCSESFASGSLRQKRAHFVVCLAFAYVNCFRCRSRFNIADMNMDLLVYIWNHKSDKRDKITQSPLYLLLLFKWLCVDHCITEDLCSLAPPPPKLMLLRSAWPGKSNFCHVRGENIVRNPIVLVPTMRAMIYEDALRKLASVFQQGTSG